MNFRNPISVLIILGTLPLSLVGSYWLLYLLGYNMSVAVGAGMIALAGVAVEIGVLMIVYLDQALSSQRSKAAAEGRALGKRDVVQAVTNGALLRVRPIMMTVSVIIAGLLPIMLGHGTGSEIMRRIAAPMVGGMVSVTVLTLLVVPVIYYLWKSNGLRSG
jgi:Cu(I)/Ag(I) efflux system membrane protein CusA/SilA